MMVRPCKNCNGSGIIKPTLGDHFDSLRTPIVFKDCKKCNGTGRVPVKIKEMLEDDDNE